MPINEAVADPPPAPPPLPGPMRAALERPACPKSGAGLVEIRPWRDGVAITVERGNLVDAHAEDQARDGAAVWSAWRAPGGLWLALPSFEPEERFEPEFFWNWARFAGFPALLRPAGAAARPPFAVDEFLVHAANFTGIGATAATRLLSLVLTGDGAAVERFWRDVEAGEEA